MKVTRKPKKLRKLTAIMFALAFTIAGVDMASADTTVTPTLDTIKTSETTYLGGTLTPYTLSTTQGTNTHSVIINGTTYWFTPKTGDKDVVTLANTGSGAIKTTTEASKAVFSVGSTYYTYDANKLPISGYKLTEHAEKQTGDITIGAKYYSIDLKTPTDKSGTGHVTYSWSSGTKAADVSFPEGKTQTIYYTYNNGGYTSSGRVNNPTSNITNKLFNGVATAANGSAIYNNDNPAGSVNITADFTNNAITNPDRHTSAAITNYSGATSATTSSLGNIIGDFINNSVTATGEYSYDIYAAAIFNRTRYGGTATIGDITGDFINNHTESESGQTNGGAIFNCLYDSDIDIAKIGNIKGNFINNYAKGTVAYGGAIYNVGTIASVTGDFTGNFADAKKSGLGGAIYNISGTIASITGDFIGNYAQGPTYARGGAINNSGTINSVTGDFINNYAKSTTGDGNVSGGAIHNEGTITDISGSFTNNYAESSSLAQGGAIYNKGTNPITIIGDFIGNHATSSTDWAIGGAIANCAGKTINFNGTNTFSNNYAQGTTAQGGAIYNKGIINFNGTNTFSGNYTTTDGTTHVANDIHNEGTINILGGTTTINGGISDAATPTGIINIGGTTDGTLSLGSDATLVAKTLTVNTTGTLIANAAALNVTNTIANAGTLTLTGDNKTNVNAISGAGTTVINGTITQTANKSIAQNIDIKDNKKLTIGATDVGGAVATNTSGEIVLNTGTINKAVSGSGKTTIDGDVTVGTDGSLVNNITVNENKKLTANAGKLGTNALANSGTLSLTGGNLAQNVSGDEGTFEVNGTVTNNDGKTIVQKVVNILSGKAFTTDVDKVTATNGIANAGTLTLTGDNKTNANAISGEGTTVINGTITQDSSKNIAQKALSILSGKSLTAGADQITTTDGISNAGTLTLTGDNKTNANAIGGEGTTIINGTITQTKDKKITNAIKVNENKSLTANAGDIGGDVTNSGNVNLKDGTLTKNITGGTTNIVADNTVNSNATYLKTDVTNNAGAVLNLTGGELTGKIITGTGTTNINGNVKINGGQLAAGTGANKVYIASDKQLEITGDSVVTLDGGSDYDRVDWDGTVFLNGTNAKLTLNHINSESGSTQNKTGVLLADYGTLYINMTNVKLSSGDIIKDTVNVIAEKDIHIGTGSDVTLNSTDTLQNSTIYLEGGNLTLDGFSTDTAKSVKVDGSTTGTGNLNFKGNVNFNNEDTIAKTVVVDVTNDALFTLDNASANVVINDIGTTTPSVDEDKWTGSVELKNGNLTLDNVTKSTSDSSKYNQSSGTLNLKGSKLTLNQYSAITGGTVELDPSELTFNNGATNSASIITADSTVNILGNSTILNTLDDTSITGGSIVVGSDTNYTNNPVLNFHKGTMTGGTMTVNKYGVLNSSGSAIQVAVVNDGIYNIENGVIKEAIRDSQNNGSLGTLNITGTTESNSGATIMQANVNVNSGKFTMGDDVTAKTKLSVALGAELANAVKKITASVLDNKGTISGAGDLVVNGAGTSSSSGTITQKDITLSNGSFTNSAAMTATGTLSNADTLTNTSTITSTGTFINSNTITGTGTLNVVDGYNDASITQANMTIAENNTNFTNNSGKDITITNTLTNNGLFTNNANVSVQNATTNDATLNNTGEIDSNAGTITANRLTNTGVINLDDSALTVTHQNADIEGKINSIDGTSTLSVIGDDQDFVGDLSVKNNSTLDLLAGVIDSSADLTLETGSILNINGKNTTATQQNALVFIDSSDVWNSTINVSNESTASAPDINTGLILEGVTKEITAAGPADYNQTGGTLVLKKGNDAEATGTSFKMYDSSKISGGIMAIDEKSEYISGANGFNLNSLYNTGTVRALNNDYEQYTMNTLFAGNDTRDVADFTVDLYGRSDNIKRYDQFASSQITTVAGDREATINISDWTLHGDLMGADAPIDRSITLPIFTGYISENDTINFTANPYREVYTPIGWYTLNGHSGGSYTLDLLRFNPQVFRGQAATLAQWENQLNIVDMMFTHSMVLPSFKDDLEDSKASSGIYANRYASTDPLYAPYQYSRKDGGLWVKMYGTFETMQTSMGGVGNNAYGALIGADFGLKELKHGWKFMPTAYIGYNGAHQYLSGAGMSQNGGQAGFLGTWYKNNFILGGLVYGGVYDNAMTVESNKASTFNYFAGASAKAAYNWRFHRDWVLQPNVLAAYNFFGQQNWHSNYGQMSMMAGNLNGVNIAPGVNLIWEKETFSTYLTLQYMFNVCGAVAGEAGNVTLPQLEMERGYIQYGIGLNKQFSDRFSGYLQAVLRNIGRNGGAFQAGFTWTLGKTPAKTEKRTDNIQKSNAKLSLDAKKN